MRTSMETVAKEQIHEGETGPFALLSLVKRE